MKKILLLPTLILIISCASSISTKLASKNHQKLSKNEQLFVLEKSEKIPANSEYIGEVKVGDTGFSQDCGYNQVISDIRISAREAGANIIQVIEIKKPDFFVSSCYRIKAKIYRNLDPETIAGLLNKGDSKNKSRLPADSDYAVIHFYRPSSGAGAFLGYKIKDANDSIVGRLRFGEKFAYKTKKFGLQSFFGALETKEEVKIDVKKGQEYFVRCGVNMGIVLGRPEINLIENYIGVKEYDEME